MKKIIGMILAAALALGMTTGTFAAKGSIVLGISDDLGYLINGEFVEPGGTYDMGDVCFSTSKELFTITMLRGMFEWSDDVPGDDPYVPIDNAVYSSSRIVPVFQVVKAKGSVKDEIKTFSLGSYSVVIKPLVTTKERKFEYFFYPRIDGDSYRDQGIRIVGTQVNETMLLSEDVDYVDVSDGKTVLEVEREIKDIKIDTGHGVVLTTKLYSGKKYYAWSFIEGDEDIEKTYGELPFYSHIKHVLTVPTEGISNATQVKLEMNGIDDSFHVYDVNMQYLGTTADILPYSIRYVITDIQLPLPSADAQTATEDKTDNS